MNKTEFLKQAKAKYKKAIDTNKDFYSEMNFIFSDKLILRVWFEHEGKVKGEYVHKWCTVQTLPIQKDNKIENEMGRFLANDFEDYSAIIKALRREVKVCPNDMIDYVQFDEKDDDKTINPIQRLECAYTIKAFCDLIGITK